MLAFSIVALFIITIVRMEENRENGWSLIAKEMTENNK